MKRNILALTAHVLALAILLTILGSISIQRNESQNREKFTGELERNVILRILDNDTAKEKGYFKEIWTPAQTFFSDVAKDPFRVPGEQKYLTDEAIRKGLEKVDEQIYSAIHTLN